MKNNKTLLCVLILGCLGWIIPSNLYANPAVFPAKMYTDAPLLFEGVEIEEDVWLNFALVHEGNEQKLVPVIGADRWGRCVKEYSGSAFQALLLLAQDKKYIWQTPIKCILNHPANKIIDKNEFLKFLLDKDEASTPRICTLNAENTLAALRMFKESDMSLNLHERTADNETLFTKWVGTGNKKLIRLMLEFDSSVIQQIQNRPQSLLTKALLHHSPVSGCPPKEARLLLRAIDKHQVAVSEEESWIIKAMRSDCSFSGDDFAKLAPGLKDTIFFAANACGNEEIINKLKNLGMDKKPIFVSDPGPYLFAYNMDRVTAKNVLLGYLAELRARGALLTQDEFDNGPLMKHGELVEKRENEIGRILGRDFMEKIIKENGLKHIKVPQKFAVLHPGQTTCSFSILPDKFVGLSAKENQFKIYAQRVPESHSFKQLSLDEARELMITLEKTGYVDTHLGNIFFTEDGIYFVDTEFRNFDLDNPRFDIIKGLKFKLKNPGDVEPFLKEAEERERAFYQNRKPGTLANQQGQEFAMIMKQKNVAKRLAEGYCNRQFAVSVQELDQLAQSKKPEQKQQQQNSFFHRYSQTDREVQHLFL